MTIIRQFQFGMAAALLAGCVAPATGPAGEDGAAALPPLPEAVVAVAAPWQDLATARLRPEDGCYWYEHDGPVERTLLPLRTPEGKPICTSAG
ncbi:hypothetical protein [Tabrizicola sp. BL-A-41-H6]|uniref:hypothetical protein n=1 Tax=Tabrizicola sp. BL-A-41-H6 TaxID=3421107 RepID=UPI003D66583A